MAADAKRWSIPLFDTDLGEEEVEAVARVISSGWLTMGEEVIALEADLRALTGARHAVAVTNGTAALQLATAALGIGHEDEVVCPTLTFVASANAARSLGARVRLCESVDEDDLTVDPASVADLVTGSTRAIVAVHYAGFAADVALLRELADDRGIALIEDAAHAVFTKRHGKTLGRHGTVGCFSFYSNKNVTCGEGGAIVTDDDELADQIRLLRSHGMTTPTLDRHRGFHTTYDVVLPGFNARMDEIRAALLRVQLRKLPHALERRRSLFRAYAERLAGSGVAVPFSSGRFATELDDTGVHIMAVLLPEGLGRAPVMARLAAEGIQTSIHYPPIHTFKAYAEGPRLARTEALAARQLTLPLYPQMSESDVDAVVEALLAAVDMPLNQGERTHAVH